MPEASSRITRSSSQDSTETRPGRSYQDNRARARLRPELEQRAVFRICCGEKAGATPTIARQLSATPRQGTITHLAAITEADRYARPRWHAYGEGHAGLCRSSRVGRRRHDLFVRATRLWPKIPSRILCPEDWLRGSFKKRSCEEESGSPVRIAVVGQDFPESFGSFIVGALRRMGHESRIFRSPATLIVFNRFLERATRLFLHNSIALRKRAEATLSNRILQWEPDLIVSTDIDLLPDTVRQLKSGGAGVVAWCPDALVNFGRQLFYLAPYDKVFLKDPYVVRHAQEFAALPVEYLPEACEPSVHRPLDPDPQDLEKFGCDILHYGNPYPSKVLFLERLAAEGHDIKAFGRHFPDWIASPVRRLWSCTYLAGDQKAKALRAAKICLNMLHYGEIEGANARLFEAAGCGAFQLVEWRRSMDELFEHGKEVIYYQSYSELQKLIEYWLPREDERRAIGEAASRRAHAEHTYEKRLERLLERVF